MAEELSHEEAAAWINQPTLVLVPSGNGYAVKLVVGTLASIEPVLPLIPEGENVPDDEYEPMPPEEARSVHGGTPCSRAS